MAHNRVGMIEQTTVVTRLYPVADAHLLPAHPALGPPRAPVPRLPAAHLLPADHWQTVLPEGALDDAENADDVVGAIDWTCVRDGGGFDTRTVAYTRQLVEWVARCMFDAWQRDDDRGGDGYHPATTRQLAIEEWRRVFVSWNAPEKELPLSWTDRRVLDRFVGRLGQIVQGLIADHGQTISDSFTAQWLPGNYK